MTAELGGTIKHLIVGRPVSSTVMQIWYCPSGESGKARSHATKTGQVQRIDISNDCARPDCRPVLKYHPDVNVALSKLPVFSALPRQYDARSVMVARCGIKPIAITSSMPGAGSPLSKY